jgi:hypothetical protein
MKTILSMAQILMQKIIPIVFAFTIISHNMSFAMGSKNIPDGKGLYFYSIKELSSFLKDIGYPDYSVKWEKDITRNSNGTAIMVFKWSKIKGYQSIVILCDGSVKEINLPSRSVWLNDKYEIIAWYENGVIHFKNGIDREEAFKSAIRTHLGGGYFIKKKT